MTFQKFLILQRFESRLENLFRIFLKDIFRANIKESLQSINQSINFYSASIPGKARLSGATAKSVFNSKNRGNSSVTSTGHGEWRYLWGKGQIKEMRLPIYLQDSNWTGWTDWQWEVVPKRPGTRVKSFSTSIGLDPRDWQTIIIAWSQWTGRNRCGKHGVKINRLFFSRMVL